VGKAMINNSPTTSTPRHRIITTLPSPSAKRRPNPGATDLQCTR